MAWISGRAAAMTAYERIVRNNTTCKTRGAFEHASPRREAGTYVVLVVHVRLMSTRYGVAVRGSCQDIGCRCQETPSDPAPGSRRLSTGFLVFFARLRQSHIIREEGASDTSEIACVARRCTRTKVLMGDAMADGACLIPQRTAGTERAKTSKLVLSAPLPVHHRPFFVETILCKGGSLTLAAPLFSFSPTITTLPVAVKFSSIPDIPQLYQVFTPTCDRVPNVEN